MTIQRVYFYVVDPGALSTMQAVVNAAPDTVNCYWVAAGYAKSHFDAEEIPYLDASAIAGDSAPGGIVVLGSQIETSKTAAMIHLLSQKNITTVFLFDHWGNYGTHFRLPDGSLVWPEKIFVMDDYVKQQLVKRGASAARLHIVGHPGIEHEMRQVKMIGDPDRARIAGNMGVASGTKIVLLALEPLSRHYSADDLDYDEYDITMLMQKAVQKLEGDPFQLVVRLHPRMAGLKLFQLLQQYNLDEKVVICPRNIPISESIAVADLVVGMYSVFLIIALAAGKRAISLQINSRVEAINNDRVPVLEHIKVDAPDDLGNHIKEACDHPCEPNAPLFSSSAANFWRVIAASA